MEKESCATQLVDGNGEFNMEGVNNFVKRIKLGDCGLSYAVVAIMGPQSSGKSTLLNHLFHTNFKEMDAYRGRNQTTKGIWIAKAVGIEPCTVVMDLEGTDGRERGEDDTTFEKQSALFALAVSDIVLVNMWCHDIGREHAANKPLLKTVFQVMMRLFSPRKTTLLFVIRDKTKTPFEYLEPLLREDVQKIWDTVSKPIAHKYTPLSDFFNVEVTALSSYEEKEEQFIEQVAHLRQRFFQSISPGGLAGDRCGVIPASGFSFSAQKIWEVIKQNKDLDLPAHKVFYYLGELSDSLSHALKAGPLFDVSEETDYVHALLGTVIVVVYMRIFLPESVAGIGIAGTGNKTEDDTLLGKDSSENVQLYKKMPSFRDTVTLLGTIY